MKIPKTPPAFGPRNRFSKTKEAKEKFYSYLLCTPPIANPKGQSRILLYHHVAGLIVPIALLIKSRFSNLPVPVGQLILLPCMTEHSIITHCKLELSSWAPPNCDRGQLVLDMLTTALARHFMILIPLKAGSQDLTGGWCVSS